MEENSIEQDLVYNNEKKKLKWIVLGLALLAIVVLALGVYVYQKGEISTVDGCLPGDKFSSTSGEPCFESELESCAEGELFDQVTGEPCESE